jgi:conjugative transposon TraM protein
MNEMQKRKSAKKLKLLLLIPLFLVSFAGVFYLAITAGNKFNGNSSSQDSARRAFNSKLPAANLKEPERNKLEIYMQAQEDSAKRKEAMDKDPYEKRFLDPEPSDNRTENLVSKHGVAAIAGSAFGSVDQNEKKVNDRLAKLYSAINQNTEENKPLTQEPSNGALSATDQHSVHELEKLLSSVQTTDSSGDPEMKRIKEVLDEVLDIQHPERIADRSLQKKAGKMTTTTPVTTNPGLPNNLSVMLESSDDTVQEAFQNRFYGLADEVVEPDKTDSTTILAVVHGDQLIHDGGKARLRLLQDIFIGNMRLPKDNFIYGICTIGNERVEIRIDNITVGNTIYPIHLIAFDPDGIEGVDVPGAMGQAAGKEGLNQALQNLELFNTDPSIGTQAAAASIQTVKSLMSRKVRQVSATLKTGQTVLLKNGQ